MRQIYFRVRVEKQRALSDRHAVRKLNELSTPAVLTDRDYPRVHVHVSEGTEWTTYVNPVARSRFSHGSILAVFVDNRNWTYLKQNK